MKRETEHRKLGKKLKKKNPKIEITKKEHLSAVQCEED